MTETETFSLEQVTTNLIRERVRSLLSEQEITLFIGYEGGAEPLHITPFFIQSENDVGRLAWNMLCINNLSTYLKRYRNQRIGLLVKGCDSRSIIELLKLNQVKRENLHIIGVPCTGILDPKKVAMQCDPTAITAIREEDGMVMIAAGDTITCAKDDVVYDKCVSCTYPNPLIYDELVADEVSPRTADPSQKFGEVTRLEQMEASDRLAYWHEQLDKCIRCYACKNVCPMCFCTECLWDKRDPRWVTKYPNPKDTFSFHMIRAYHMVGRCTGCMECERVCPVDIPLGTIFRKIEKDVLELFDYVPGIDQEAVPPLNTYEEGDESHEQLLRKEAMMGDKILAKENAAALIQVLLDRSEVVAPVMVGAQASFKKISSADEMRWDYANATVPPTEHLLPPSETLFHYERHGSDVSLLHAVDETERTMIGIRPCDVHGIRMLDRVFTGRFEDPYYLARRNHTTLISLMCDEPGASCYCTSFGTGPDLDADGGSDLHLIDQGTHFYVRIGSERGQEVVDQASHLFSDADEADRQGASRAAATAAGKVRRHLDTEGLSDALQKMFDSPYWEKISHKCIACGACTYLCPVCYCFDVTDTCSTAQGERTRCWDACTYRSFALLSGGHNPRPTIKEAYRQKMYHKFTYAVQRHGYSLCVGCGRCLDSCPVNLDIVRVLTEAKAEAEGVAR